MRPLVPFVCRLTNRRVVRVRGTEAHDFLQGLFTNDLRELHPSGSLYGCFLYFTGRVMCDAYLYQCKRVHDGQASILVDVHESCAEELVDHLTEMKMRKKVVIEDVGEDLTVVAALEHSGDVASSAEACGGDDRTTASSSDNSNNSNGSGGSSHGRHDGSALEGHVLSSERSPSQTLEERHTECFADPRNGALFPAPSGIPKPTSEVISGSLGTASGDGAAAAAATSSPASRSWFLKRCVMPLTWAPPLSIADPYFELLYSRGIGEGPSVFKNNKTLPFEGNLDFLKGVSFHKGCYLGQELTHRTHVMLVTRKRTVPLLFGSAEQPVARIVEVGESLYTAEKERIGEVSGVCGGVGIGLLRLRYVEKESRTVPGLQLKDGTPVQASLPDWWPRKEVKKLLKNNS
ncbi:Aminomethyltransferase folate-binding domain containing protein [Lotmaria passim]